MTIPWLSHYAWIIDQDHLSGPKSDHFDPEYCCESLIGPRNANGTDKDELTHNYEQHHQFRMYDDDGILYVTGTLYWNGGEPDEDYVYGPLADYGTPGMGAILIKYTGKPEWDCG